MYHPILITLIVLISSFLLYLSFLIYFVFRPPPNNPRAILRLLNSHSSSNKFRVVFVGDSITHGTMSVNYVDMISSSLGSDHFIFINAGVNADTTYDVLLRLEDIILCEPDIIVILIGTNDVLQFLDLSPLKIINSILKHSTHPKPTKSSFRHNLELIIQRLLSHTNAVIGLCSLPPLSEDPSSVPFKESISFSHIIRDVAFKYNLHYLPINERMRSYLSAHPSSPKYPLTPFNVERVYLRELLLRETFDRVSRANGFSLLIDNIHLNSVGARIVADTIISFIHSVLSEVFSHYPSVYTNEK